MGFMKNTICLKYKGIRINKDILFKWLAVSTPLHHNVQIITQLIWFLQLKTYNFETPFSCISDVSFIRNREILNNVSGWYVIKGSSYCTLLKNDLIINNI